MKESARKNSEIDSLRQNRRRVLDGHSIDSPLTLTHSAFDNACKGWAFTMPHEGTWQWMFGPIAILLSQYSFRLPFPLVPFATLTVIHLKYSLWMLPFFLSFLLIFVSFARVHSLSQFYTFYPLFLFLPTVFTLSWMFHFVGSVPATVQSTKKKLAH